MVTPTEVALADEVARLEREEAAAATKAEKAADPSLNQPTANVPAGGGADQVRAQVEALQALPPELATPILIAGLDLVGRRVALWAGGEEAGQRYALTKDERELLNEVWLPVVRHYLPQLAVHPLLAAGGVTALVYALKALPEGGLEAVLGGNGGAAAPRAAQPPPMPNDLLKKQEPTADAVLELARQKAEELAAAKVAA